MKQHLKALLKKNKTMYDILLWCYTYYNAFMIWLKMLFFRFLKIKEKKIIIVSYFGKGYGDNGKYLAEEFLKSNEYEVYWATKEQYKKSLPENIKYVKYNSIKYYYHLSTAKIWINNSRFPLGTIKRKKQFYFLGWHSSLRMKKIEREIENMLPKQYVKSCISDSKKINLMSSGCEVSYNTYRNYFWYNGEIVKYGTPRCDLFFNNDAKAKLKDKICNKYNIPKDNKIILYAPTFRRNSNSGYLDVNKFCEKLSNNLYTILVRFHPISKQSFKSHNNIINVTEYNDMQELICISDFLVTDFSGCCFDMMINNKPCILYLEDIKKYLSNERELNFLPEDLPFSKVYSVDELVNEILHFNANDYYKKIIEFSKKINLKEDGNASKNIVLAIKERI